MLMLDLDLFKAINDKYGHLGGDKVLARFAQTVGLELRDSDIFGRLGGEGHRFQGPRLPVSEWGK